MRTFAAVTTFSRSGFELYGERMVQSFVKMWPREVVLHVYPDDPVPLPKSVNVRSQDHLLKPKQRFMRRTSGAPEYQGRGGTGYNYRFDVRKFAHKPFAVWDAACRLRGEVDALLWIDADTLTHSPVSLDTVSNVFCPAEADVGFLGRAWKYSECGFIYFNLQGKGFSVIDEWLAFYRDLSFRNQAEWHDSFLFDRARGRVENLQEHNWSSHLTKRKGGGHPLANSVLGQWMDHLKGDARKATGRPRKNDLFAAHDQHYWSKENAHARYNR